MCSSTKMPTSAIYINCTAASSRSIHQSLRNGRKRNINYFQWNCYSPLKISVMMRVRPPGPAKSFTVALIWGGMRDWATIDHNFTETLMDFIDQNPHYEDIVLLLSRLTSKGRGYSEKTLKVIVISWFIFRLYSKRQKSLHHQLYSLTK